MFAIVTGLLVPASRVYHVQVNMKVCFGVAGSPWDAVSQARIQVFSPAVGVPHRDVNSEYTFRGCVTEMYWASIIAHVPSGAVRPGLRWPVVWVTMMFGGPGVMGVQVM
jgi:hypothetical protein